MVALDARRVTGRLGGSVVGIALWGLRVGHSRWRARGSPEPPAVRRVRSSARGGSVDIPTRRRREGYWIVRACNNFVTLRSISDGPSVPGRADRGCIGVVALTSQRVFRPRGLPGKRLCVRAPGEWSTQRGARRRSPASHLSLPPSSTEPSSATARSSRTSTRACSRTRRRSSAVPEGRPEPIHPARRPPRRRLGQRRGQADQELRRVPPGRRGPLGCVASGALHRDWRVTSARARAQAQECSP